MKNRPLLLIFLIIFFDLLAFGIVIPILPYYTKSYGANAFQLGWIMAIYSIMQFIFAPIWGRLSDRFGRKPILLVSILGASFAMLGMGLANNLWLIFLARGFAGAFAANISTASAYIADVTDETNRAKGMGIIGAGFGLGFVFGPAIGGVLSPYGYNVPILFAAGLALCNFVLTLLILPEPDVDLETRKKNSRRGSSWEAFNHVFSRRKIAIPVTLFFITTFAFTNLEVTFALFVLHRYEYDAYEAGLLLAMVGVVMAIIQGGMIGRLSKKFGEEKLVVFGLFCMAGSLLGAAWTTYIGIFVFCLFWMAVGNALVNPSLLSLASKGATADERGIAMGVYQSSGALARIVGPPIAGLIFDTLGIEWPFVFACVVLIITLSFAVKLFSAIPQES